MRNNQTKRSVRGETSKSSAHFWIKIIEQKKDVSRVRKNMSKAWININIGSQIMTNVPY